MRVKAIFCIFAILLLAGCSSRGRILMMIDEPYPSNRTSTIALYKGELDVPKIDIARLESLSVTLLEYEFERRSTFQPPVEAKAKMLDDLEKKARKVGADAIESVKLEFKDGRGLIRDETTPFPSLRQGAYRRYYLSGIALRLLEPIPEGESRDFELDERF